MLATNTGLFIADILDVDARKFQTADRIGDLTVSEYNLIYSDEVVRFDRESAIVVSAPSWDRAIEPADLANQIQPEIESTVDVDPQYANISTRIQHHQIGSAAEWSRTLAVVFESTEPTIGYISGLAGISGFALSVIRRIRELNRTKMAELQHDTEGIQPRDMPPTITLLIAIGMAAGHYRENYGYLENVEVRWFVRSIHPGALIEDPPGSETYTITIATPRENVVYTINSEGTGVEHLLATPERVICLDLPNFLGDDAWMQSRTLASGRVS